MVLAGIFTCMRVTAGPGEQPFVVSGEMKKVKQGKIFLVQQASMVEKFRNPAAYLHDSAVIRDGKFTFKGVIKDDIVPVYLTMQLPVTEAQREADPLAGYRERYFYLTGGKTRLAGNGIDDAVFSGSAEMALFMKLDSSLASQRMAYDSIFKKQLKVSWAGYAAQMDSVKRLQAQIESDFIVRHPSALLNIVILKGRAALAETTTAGAIGSLVEALSPALRNRPDMTAIAKRMKALSSLVVGNPALDFSLPDTAGRTVALSSLRGKYVLIEFWASWCGPCRMQVPYLKKSYAAWHDKGFEILGVSLDDSREKWMKAIHDEQLPWPQLSDVKGLESAVVPMYGITGIPLNYLLDTNGIIIARDLRDNELSEKLSALLAPDTSNASEGIHFEHTLSWAQVKAKAKAEHKYIFMDCYATWCAPCVKMIKELFPKKELGDFFNDKFICVKLQLDKTGKDDDYVKSWYKDAEMIQATYIPPSMPTFFYFSPEGELVHQVPGAEDAAGLIAKSAAALDTSKQYFTLIKKFERSDKKDLEMMKRLAIMSQQVMAKDNARKYATQYIQSQKDLLTEENIRFVNRFASSGKDPGFNIFLHHAGRVDEVLGKGFAVSRVRQVIFSEELVPRLTNGTVPDWKSMTAAIAAKYPGHAEPVVSKYKAQFYMVKGDWPNFQQSVMAYMDKYGEEEIEMYTLNVFAGTIYRHATCKAVIPAALGWSKRALAADSTNPEFLEVYAGLLYRSAQQEEALAVMEKAVSQAKGSDKEEYGKILEKMKRREQTWME